MGKFRIVVIVFPSKHYVPWSPAVLGMAEHWPAGGK